MNKKKGVTSTEAAAMLMSNGATKDPAKAALIAQGNDLDMDALQRAHLRRMMGFDFRMKQQPNKIHVSTTKPPYLSTHCKIKEGETDKYNNIISEDLIDRLVDACARLKVKHDKDISNGN